jgi:hypothetical protein
VKGTERSPTAGFNPLGGAGKVKVIRASTAIRATLEEPTLSRRIFEGRVAEMFDLLAGWTTRLNLNWRW